MKLADAETRVLNELDAVDGVANVVKTTIGLLKRQRRQLKRKVTVLESALNGLVDGDTGESKE